MKKLISILLLLAMMLTVFVACGGGDNGDGKDTTAATPEDGTTGEGNAIVDNRLAPNDLNGYVFRWLEPLNGQGIVVDEGEVVDDTSIAYQARVERDAEVVDRLNIGFKDITSEGAAEIVSYVIKDALNSESSFDVGLIAGPEDASTLITGDMIIDAREVPHLRLDREWYQQQANEEYSVMGKQYFVAGAFPSFPGTPAFIFNKDMMVDLNLELPYDTIVEGNWTVEELMKYTANTYQDTNAAIVGPDADDTFGYAGHPRSICYFYQGMGGPTTTRNDAGEVVPVFSNDTVDAIFSKVNEFYFDSNNYARDTDAENSHMNFFNGNSLFCYWVTGTISYQDIDTFERGLAILPKYDLDQESYYCPSVGGIKLFPANLADADPVGYIYESLCEATLRIVYPATIQEAVDFETLTDEGSIAVQEVVDQSLMFDILKNCDPSGNMLGSCGFVWYCIQNNSTPAAQAQMFKPVYEKMFSDFFANVSNK